MSVLIVKIIPGQEFISNYFALVPTWPSQDDHSSLSSNLRLLFRAPPPTPDLAGAERGIPLDPQQQIIAKSNKLINLGWLAPKELISLPRYGVMCVLDNADTCIRSSVIFPVVSQDEI